MNPRHGRFLYPAVLAAFVFSGMTANAQSLSGVTFHVDNDYFEFWMPGRDRPDDNYTHGQALRTVFNAAPKWARRDVLSCSEAVNTSPAPKKCAQSFLFISQEIFTPTNDSPTPMSGERPYAGLLYADFGRSIVDRRQSRSLAVRLGTTGRASGAEAAQTTFHRLTDQRLPKGWKYQIGTEPLMGVTYGRQYFMTPGLVSKGFALQMIGQGGATGTHVQAKTNAGLEMKAGYGLPHPWIPAPDSSRRGFRAFVMLGGSETWVARDLLLEGNTRYTTGLVDRRLFVFESMWGLGVGLGSYAVEYRAVSRSREYATGPSWKRWGRIAIVHGNP